MPRAERSPPSLQKSAPASFALSEVSITSLIRKPSPLTPLSRTPDQVQDGSPTTTPSRPRICWNRTLSGGVWFVRPTGVNRRELQQPSDSPTSTSYFFQSGLDAVPPPPKPLRPPLARSDGSAGSGLRRLLQLRSNPRQSRKCHLEDDCPSILNKSSSIQYILLADSAFGQSRSSPTEKSHSRLLKAPVKICRLFTISHTPQPSDQTRLLASSSALLPCSLRPRPSNQLSLSPCQKPLQQVKFLAAVDRQRGAAVSYSSLSLLRPESTHTGGILYVLATWTTAERCTDADSRGQCHPQSGQRSLLQGRNINPGWDELRAQ